jgi:hypothetical protein
MLYSPWVMTSIAALSHSPEYNREVLLASIAMVEQ